MSRLTVKDLHTNRQFDCSEKSWEISLKNTVMPNNKEQKRYVLVTVPGQKKTNEKVLSDTKKLSLKEDEKKSTGGDEDKKGGE